MVFEIGKYYRHSTGICASIICEANTTMWGKTLVAERSDKNSLESFGGDEDAARGWEEITRDEWMLNFE